MYKIEVSRQAEKALEKVYRFDRSLYQRFINALDDILKDPFQGKSLHGELRGLLSYRMGNYRIRNPQGENPTSHYSPELCLAGVFFVKVESHNTGQIWPAKGRPNDINVYVYGLSFLLFFWVFPRFSVLFCMCPRML